MEKQNMVYAYSGILAIKKNETLVYYNMITLENIMPGERILKEKPRIT